MSHLTQDSIDIVMSSVLVSTGSHELSPVACPCCGFRPCLAPLCFRAGLFAFAWHFHDPVATCVREEPFRCITYKITEKHLVAIKTQNKTKQNAVAEGRSRFFLLSLFKWLYLIFYKGCATQIRTAIFWQALNKHEFSRVRGDG